MNRDIEILVLTEHALPEYASDGAAGADVRAALLEPVLLMPGHSMAVPTGLFFEIPLGYEIQVRPRSGLALKNQVTVLNTPGTIDSDYRGELKVILINHSSVPFEILPGMRIAQIVVAPISHARFVLATELTSTKRGCSGFGHTGVN